MTNSIKSKNLSATQAIANFQSTHYFKKGVTFLSFNDLTLEQSKQVLVWRNHPNIRKWMYNPSPIEEAAHFRFLKNLASQKEKNYWLVQNGKRDLGVINLSNYKNLEGEWGFYLNPALFGSGLAINLVKHALDFFFIHLGFNRLHGHVSCFNTEALLLHEFFKIRQIGLKQLQFNSSIKWYSYRTISKEDWLSQNASVKELKKRLLNNALIIKALKKEILLRQLKIIN